MFLGMNCFCKCINYLFFVGWSIMFIDKLSHINPPGAVWWVPWNARSSGGVTTHHKGVSSGWSNIWHCSYIGLPGMSNSQFYLGFGHSVWFSSLFLFVRSIEFGGFMVKLQLIYWNCSIVFWLIWYCSLWLYFSVRV